MMSKGIILIALEVSHDISIHLRVKIMYACVDITLRVGVGSRESGVGRVIFTNYCSITKIKSYT